jgi:uroporphyrinogen III methyltransferase/synthase
VSNVLDAKPKVGHVALVGAGPGDPSLLTLRAAELLRVADVVAHDELVSEAILAMVPARAELLAVGRRIGQGEVTHRLHPEVKARALRGLRVVRLKAGDPLIFGRGGEEAEELAEAGIPFEIVPGISAALGAAAYAGVPLTHRNHSAQVVIASGHRADGGLPPPAILGGRTLVLYMSTHELATNLAAVIANGWPPSTPAAMVASATTYEERVVTGTLATLAEIAAGLGIPRPRQPALVLIGDVVEVRGKIDWRRHLPLRGRSVIVARTRPGGSELARKLRDLGAIVMELPHVERRKEGFGHGQPDVPVCLSPARWPSRCDAVVLPASFAALSLYELAPESLRRVPAIAIGPRTAEQAIRSGALDVRTAARSDMDAVVEAVVALFAPSATVDSDVRPATTAEAAQ